MMRRRTFAAAYLVALIVLLAAAAALRRDTLTPRASAMELPADYRLRFIHYLTVDRVDLTVRHLYIAPQAYEAVRRGEELPDGTQVIIEAYHARLDLLGRPLRDAAGRFLTGEMFPSVHMMEKRARWRIEDLATSIGAGRWNFETFNARTFAPTSENRNDCFTCHDTAFQRDMLFSQPNLRAFALDEQPRYLYCNLPERGNCQ
jgi:hypothetical protein